jgi:hypothetical protein
MINMVSWNNDIVPQDFVINAFTAHWDRRKGYWLLSLPEIWWHYLTHWLIIDFVSAIPTKNSDTEEDSGVQIIGCTR